MNAISEAVDKSGFVPLGWAGSTSQMNYLNLGDALSPVMVSLLSGKPVQRLPTKSNNTRMAAVGTIGHTFSGGNVYFWGTGCSNWKNPSAEPTARIPFVPTNDSKFHVNATRGPISEKLLNNGKAGSGVYGDPVWLLPSYFNPTIKKRWKLGCILHLSELADRSFEARAKPELTRYGIPEHLSEDIHLITMVSEISPVSMKQKICEILSCERIVSTSLHGMVLAEAYNIPCLYFSPHGITNGPEKLRLTNETRIDLRILDLYLGIGCKDISVYQQKRGDHTDWTKLLDAIDGHWSYKDFDAAPLIESFPLPIDNKAFLKMDDIWNSAHIKSMIFQHNVADLQKLDKSGYGR